MKPPPQLSADGQFWWDGSAWQPCAAPPSPSPSPSPVPPIRLTSWRVDGNVIDIWFGDTSVPNVAGLLNRFLLAWGLRFDRGTAADGHYSSNAGRPRQNYAVTVSEHMGSVHAVIGRTMSSGANHKALAVALAAVLSDPRQLQQSAPVPVAPLAVRPHPGAVAVPPAPKPDNAAAVLAGVAVIAGALILALIFGPALLKNSATAAQTQNQTDNNNNSNNNNNNNNNNSDPAASSGPAPNCVPSNTDSPPGLTGYDFRKYVDSTSTAPCYAHWNITLGPNCQYFLDGSTTSQPAPSNVWNIDSWGFGNGNTVAYLDDGHWMLFTCTINSRGEVLTTLHDPDWS